MPRTASGGERTFGTLAFISLLTALLYVAVVRAQQLLAFGAPSLGAVALYVTATFGLFSLYIAVVGLASRGAIRDRRARAAALVAPIVIQGGLIWAPPTLSIDLFSYLAHGKQVQLGKSPYAEPVKEMQHTSYGEELLDRGWLPVHGVSPYGPLWTWTEVAVARAATNVDVQARLTKALAVFFSLICAWLIWGVLRRVEPHRQMEGTLLYLWNPVVIVEFAADGHNDAIATAGVLAALLFTVSGRPSASLLALGSGALVKVTALVAFLPQAVLWFRRWSLPNVPRFAAASILLAVAAALLYAPFWIGGATFDGMWGHGRPSVLPSTQGVLFWVLTQAYAPHVVAPLLSLMMTGAFAAYALRTSLRVTDEHTALRACGCIAVAYLLLAPGYWPWYAVLPIALLALSPGGGANTTLVLVSLGARLAAPVDRLRVNGLMEWETEVIVTTAIGLWLPAVALAIAASANNRPRFAACVRRLVSSTHAPWKRIGRRHPVGGVMS